MALGIETIFLAFNGLVEGYLEGFDALHRHKIATASS